MKEAYRTDNVLEVALLKSLFDSEGLHYFVFDEHQNCLGGGFLRPYAPCRFMVMEEDFDAATALLKKGGLLR